jgi:hypothetical protein
MIPTKTQEEVFLIVVSGIATVRIGLHFLTKIPMPKRMTED